jgi:hypothetical protein
MKKNQPALLMTIAFIICSLALNAQKKKIQNDSTYYETFPDKLNIRIYLSQKYVHLNIPSGGDISDLEYKANRKLNLGAGFSYRGITINIFNGFSFLNTKDEPKGKTTGLGLQIHFYPQKWAIDLIAELPKGFHLEPEGMSGAAANNYYYRADVKSNLYGISAYRVPNKEKFSYRAAISQTEWQKKSAGSFLYGGGIFHGMVQGDSALIPALLKSKYPETDVKKITYTTLGPGVGYAHTLVIDQHFFVTGSLVLNANVNFVSEEGTQKEKKTSFNGSDVFKAAIGYNSATWNFSANWLGHGLWIKGPSTNENYFFPSGQVRVVVAHKFDIHKHHS